jgi:DNA-binding GntR family transcriptional regulator
MQVTRFSNGEAEQILEMTIEVEPLAFNLAGQKISREQIAELRDLLAKARQGAASQSLQVFFENHLAYRRKVWELSGNRFLKQILELVAPLYAICLMRATFITGTDCFKRFKTASFTRRKGCTRLRLATLRKRPNFLQQMKDSLGA